MKLSETQVKHVAKLANLPLTEEETKEYSDQLSKILDYIDQLNKVDTTGVASTYNVSEVVSVMAEDVPKDCLTQEGALQNASLKKNGFFATKGVFENE
ncbi:MAG: Aspartyl/glutamyl-tRNA(Asn/Gln) amidotransferase subunit C [Candidatus Daviesbacteria bacterium GW2011_GWA2_38_24]|uniref:Aspartyl/glutamyl-tRNA(Asn/Gln) amidotransferase subunit C n=1 Tax=Candidatus Daviesbacteria bacterium GW2011_GWA2_38_24 TaxID=1618422 RepID=A0A0G0JVK5_9BACT|nr:MAG: Aspartyl/glutamyl-tRNA(Asn/Gln) amidotransferase subunit C [Candidatus Daviesbacteria bacterium GW2011_GWA2_38_24]KKQ80146.1 MAG: Aspartyl/glutamyl-tRNA(Asn/Gln) amidotransferase subunit C [Candidatus Daviesbacteria bacterium GW2011_GWA1_38_7]OGE22778.1 MAG: hypothetical protein A2688_00785 [Candidatus Daviesbacteria bacterium RIFCSPHIGHO2_01_FULL_38_8]